MLQGCHGPERAVGSLAFRVICPRSGRESDIVGATIKR